MGQTILDPRHGGETYVAETQELIREVDARVREERLIDRSSGRMLRVGVVAEILDLPERRVYELVRAGLIPHVRVGRSVRFNSRKLEEWIDAGGTGYGDSE